MMDAVDMANAATKAAAAAHSNIVSNNGSTPPADNDHRPAATSAPTTVPASGPITASATVTTSVPVTTSTPVTSSVPCSASTISPAPPSTVTTPTPATAIPTPSRSTPAHVTTSAPSPSVAPRSQSALPTSTTRPSNFPNTPFISYATQTGLANHLLPSQPTDRNVVPTFHSEWAHLAPEETRPVRENLLETKQTRDHPRLFSSFLSGVHEWYPLPVNNMSYKYYIENEREDVRSDLVRYKIMMILHKETAHEAWSRFVESREWFIVPSTLRCDRTFCRDAFDCYYVDRMDRAFACDEERSTSECPLFRHDVLDRWWNAFSRKPDFLFELFVRTTARALVSYDSFETVHYTADELRQCFPEEPAWMRDLDIPAGIPLPLAPVVYYFASDLRVGADEKRYRRAHWFLKREHMGLIVAFWYNEMMHGGRQWVLKPSSINTLREHCLPMDIIKGVPTADILNMMMGNRVRDATYWNTYKSGAAAIPDCHFVDCEQGSGDYLPWMTGRRVELANMKSRKVKLALRQHRRVQVRRSSPLSLRLLVADLVRIPGLDNFVKDQNWLQVDSLRVHDLISKLFARNRRQNDRITKLERELRSTKFDRDGIRAAFQESERDLDRSRHDLQSERRRNDYGTRASPAHEPRHIPRNRNNPIPQAHSPFIAPEARDPVGGNLPRVPRRPPSDQYYAERHHTQGRQVIARNPYAQYNPYQ